MKKLSSLCALCAVLFSASAFAEAPAAPTPRFAGYINGRVNLMVLHDDAASFYVFQAKAAGADDSAYRTVTPTSSIVKWKSNTTTVDAFSFEMNYAGSLVCRVAAVNSAQERSDWATFDPVASTLRYATTVSGGNLTFKTENTVDGQVWTFTDGNANPLPYSIYDLGEAKSVGKIRYVVRLGFVNRAQNAVIESSDRADFSVSTTHATLASATSTDTRVEEIVLDPPVTARYFRYTGQYGNVSEFELVPSAPTVPDGVVTADISDLTNLFPVVTVVSPVILHPESYMLQRSAGRETGYTNVWAEAETDLSRVVTTNTDLLVGQTVFYRLKIETGRPEYAEAKTVYTAPLRYTRGRRLDRAWGAEGTLLEGVTVMSPNEYSDAASATAGGCTGWGSQKNAFDGNASSWPDIYGSVESYKNPRIGLDFGSAHVYVAGLRALPRSNQLGRGKTVAGFAGTESDQSDKVQCTDVFAAFADGEDFRYFPSKTSQAAARYVWIESPSGYAWCGNMAELQVFGWTQEDVEAAGTLSAPDSLTVESVDAETIGLVWTPGANASTYTVQRRVQGETAWTDVATGLTALSHEDGGLVTGTVYEYRVVAVGAAGAEATDPVARLVYAQGDGTGLAALYRAGLPFGIQIPAEGASETRAAENPRLALADTDILGAGASDNVKAVWSGTIAVPKDGNYTFRADTDLGAALVIDGSVVFDNCTAAQAYLAGSVSLQAGVHDILVAYRHATGPKRFVLYWSGAVGAETVIPVSQLKPAAVPASDEIPGWRTLDLNARLLFLPIATPTGLTVMGGGGDYGSADYHLMGREMEGDFVLQAHPTSLNGGKFILMCRNVENADYYSIGYSSSGLGSQWRKFIAAESSQRTEGDWSRWDGVAYFRLERKGNVFNAYRKPNASDSWELFATWTDADGRIGRKAFVGIGLSGANQDDLTPHSFTVDHLKLYTPGGMLLILK